MTYPSSHYRSNSSFSSELGYRTSATSVLSSTASTASTAYTQFTLPIASQYSSYSYTRKMSGEVEEDEYQVEHVDMQANWYRKYFFGKDHPTFIGIIEPHGPLIISIILDSITIKSNLEGIAWYRYIVRRKERPDERGTLAGSSVSPFGEPIWDSLLRMINKDFSCKQLTKFITTPELSEELLNLDESRFQKSYKVGVLYCAPSQRTEEEWFSNTKTSYEYDHFLEILGKKIRLQGWDGFKGGLDTKTGETGEYSVYDSGTWNDFEIMYHVSTMLPYGKDKHQVTRKKHIGNDPDYVVEFLTMNTFIQNSILDIVCIIFQDVPLPFSPSSIRSQFLHVFLVVSPMQTIDGSKAYIVDIVYKNGVPNFGPMLPNPPVFYNMKSLKKFLVAAVINGQNAAWKTPKLNDPFIRARNGRIDDLTKKYAPIILAPLTSCPQSPKKISQEELDTALRRLFTREIRTDGSPPDIMQVKSLLDQGANPNIKISRSRRSRDQYISDLMTQDTTIGCGKLPNILFATILLSDDPVYVKLLINYGCETMPRDKYYPNAFVFAARHQRVETMRCLLENVPALSDPQSVDAAINERFQGGCGSHLRERSYGTKIWYGIAGEMKKLKKQIMHG
ncbi:10036_t:CDS:2 [Acaulospora morrowiae]|uniref:10036_t:CDS:1 n=1 Tax=Acaulospora morrowiae TaxID=94023 RepID=A0A9N9C7T4_9GLOM|nr:10036_t:CDS:2 [Acaulospora morrowiae]